MPDPKTGAAFHMTIHWTPGGRIHVEGNALTDKGASYAMLELAKDAVREHVAKQRSIVIANKVPEVANG